MMNIQTYRAERPKLFPPKALAGRMPMAPQGPSTLSDGDLRRIVSEMVG